jgi:hypothetical protein
VSVKKKKLSPPRSGGRSQRVKNEELTRIQLNRANLLFDYGAIPKSAQEIAQNAEDDNMVVLETTKEHPACWAAAPATWSRCWKNGRCAAAGSTTTRRARPTPTTAASAWARKSPPHPTGERRVEDPQAETEPFFDDD